MGTGSSRHHWRADQRCRLPTESNGEWEFAWQAGVVWQLPVRDVVRSEAVVQAELNVAKAEAALQAAIEEVEDAVWEAYRKVELALRRVERLEDQVAHAEFLLELAQNRLKAGLTARVTVLEAEWVLATTENALADAEREPDWRSSACGTPLGRT